MKTDLHWPAQLPNPHLWAKNSVLIYDELLWQRSSRFRLWARRFPARMAVQGGETLKELRHFPELFEGLLQLSTKVNPASLQLIAVGGGSVGDFVGFVASVLWRGRPWIHLPSTWLAALDSAHGGKTALNACGAKNQLGTFHPARAVYVVEELLALQEPELAQEAMGELVKIALIDGGGWTRAFLKASASAPEQLKQFLPQAVAAKYRVLKQDPLETKGVRRLLNLGHTLGHILEAHYGLAHGSSVAEGLYFSLEWSWSRGYLNDDVFSGLNAFLQDKLGFRWVVEESVRLKPATFKRLALADKKHHESGGLDFIFLRGWGCPFLEKIEVAEFCREAELQGWVR